MVASPNYDSWTDVVHWVDANAALNKQLNRLPSQLQFDFEAARNNIKDKIEAIVASKNWECNLDDVARIEFDKWVYRNLKTRFYRTYVSFINSLWWIPLDIEKFRYWEGPDPKAETPWKRFMLIKERWIKPGMRIIKRWETKIFTVEWITSDLKLKLEWMDELENPVDFICFDSFKHLKSQWIKIWELVTDTKSWKMHKVVWITSMWELKLEWFNWAKNAINFVKAASNVVPLKRAA